MTVYLKALGPKREAINGGTGVWPYRKWTEPTPPVPCESGWHVCTPSQMLGWLPPTRDHIWVVEIGGDIINDGNKIVAERARLVRRLDWCDRSARLFAADCAERVLPLFESLFSGDTRPRDAVVVARRFAVGEASAAELTAAEDAAWAARAAAEAAAWAAAWAAARAAEAAAWAAARDAEAAAWAADAAAWAAEDAARDAARAAARDPGAAEQEWQADRLLHHIGANRNNTP